MTCQVGSNRDCGWIILGGAIGPGAFALLTGFTGNEPVEVGEKNSVAVWSLGVWSRALPVLVIESPAEETDCGSGVVESVPTESNGRRG